jgi:site-specific DNA recombinase
MTVAQGAIDWNDFTGRLIYNVQQEGKHQFLRDLARNSLRGLIARTKQGKWNGPAPYGYELGDEGHLVFGDARKVATVRKIYRLRLSGYGYRVIAKKLNADGVEAPQATKWSHDTVRLILCRETYCGVVTLGGRKQGKYFTTDGDSPTPVKSGVRRGTSLRVENAHEAIIDRPKFDAVQSMLVSLTAETAVRALHWLGFFTVASAAM